MKHYIPFFLLLFSFSAQGAVNKWVDAQGTVHYSDDAPPPEVKQTGTVKAPSPANGAQPQKSVMEREQERQQAQKAKEEEDRKEAGQQDNEQVRRDNCKALLANLSILTGSGNVVYADPGGDAKVMGADERKKQTEDTRKQIAQLKCDGQ